MQYFCGQEIFGMCFDLQKPEGTALKRTIPAKLAPEPVSQVGASLAGQLTVVFHSTIRAMFL
jgi:hypothetical protein